MSSTEIATIKKLIKDIKYKLNELERAIDKSPQTKFAFPINSQQVSPRKRNNFRESGYKANKS